MRKFKIVQILLSRAVKRKFLAFQIKAVYSSSIPCVTFRIFLTTARFRIPAGACEKLPVTWG